MACWDGHILTRLPATAVPYLEQPRKRNINVLKTYVFIANHCFLHRKRSFVSGASELGSHIQWIV
jgi:hypothetical protein